jgi:hypothetical protein
MFPNFFLYIIGVLGGELSFNFYKQDA